MLFYYSDNSKIGEPFIFVYDGETKQAADISFYNNMGYYPSIKRTITCEIVEGTLDVI